jgi:hypothetical protein
MVRKLVPLALVVFALAAVPVALGDDGTNPTPGSTAPPAPTTQGQAGRGDAARLRLQILQDRLRLVGLRFARNCRGGANGSSQQCVAFAQKVETKLQQLDTNVQARIAKLQACTTTSTDAYCKNADTKIALLQKIDQWSWLDGQVAHQFGGNLPHGSPGLDFVLVGVGVFHQRWRDSDLPQEFMLGA